MATMGLGLGGAETHIVELSKSLADKGCKVACISSGGVYVDELAAHGIPHFDAPMQKRSAAAMLKSFFAMRRAVRRFRPDVIHGHARIPNFICSIVASLYHIPFVTTAHFNFKTSGALGFMSRWGSRQIAVSEDLKKYLIDNYMLSPDKISVTINGIATEKFSPNADCGGLAEELSLPGGKRVILNVSRMDHNACAASFRLISAAEEIYKAHPDTHIVIVGGGDALEEIKAKADAVNQNLGEKYITVTGGRSDIFRFCALCDIFVGVSRAALEAMSCGKPTVLAGNQGYLGLYLPEKLPQCIATNFTCRDIPYPSDETLAKDVISALSMSAEQYAENGRICRDLIISDYSADRMASDALDVYKAVQYDGRKKYDYLLCGYYGFNNSGDDAMLYACINNLRAQNPDVRICVLTKEDKPEKDGIYYAARFSFFAINKAISHSRVLLFGGGNLIQDATSTKSLIYYLTLLKIAKSKGLGTMLYANGIGPVSGAKNRKRTAKMLNKTDVITLREERSKDLLSELSVTSPKIELTADEVLTLYSGQKYENGGYIAVSIRDFSKIDAEFNDKLAFVLNETAGGRKILFVPLQKAADTARCEGVAKLLRVPYEIDTSENFADKMELIGKADIVIGMRLHSLIFGVGAAVPAVGLVYDPKIDGFLNYLGITKYFYCESIDKDGLCTAVNSAFSEDRAALAEKAAELSKKAHRNSILANELLEGNI